ncbi:MAG: hypothetical protein JW837_17865 [Sedimentisphaerales bacterium]|nr:hypothetical protein [Sedimentisphaerales bacterium]
MKSILPILFVTVLFSGCDRSDEVTIAPPIAMECEAYQVNEGKKTHWTKFKVSYDATKDIFRYEKLSGPDWIIPKDTNLKLIWKSQDGLRFVVRWIDDQYGKDDKVWSPVTIIDFDFSNLRYSVTKAGGFSDFAEIVYDPWEQECRRLN